VEFRQVKYFLQVVESGSFSAAAEELYTSQSSLSKQIMALEKELGFELFDRSKRKIALTAAGKVFLPYARQLNTTYQSMLAGVVPYKRAPSLSLIAIPVIAQYGIPAHIAHFKRVFPEIQLALEEREASEILPMLNRRQFDLAFVRDNFLDKNQYECIEVARDQFQVVLSHQHRLANSKWIALAELADENFVMFDKGTMIHELAVEACRSAGFEPRIFYASLRVESVLGMVASNSGVALMMQKVFEYRGHPNVVAVPLRESIPSNLVLAWPKEAVQSKSLTCFVDFMKSRLEVP
jgi:LysR family transcriptional regulator, transcription activator of glutamate synthase operon